MDNFSGEAPLVEVTRTELTVSQTLLGSVIALAASDCRRAIEAVENKSLTGRALAEAASACCFFLSQEGQGMIAGVGLDVAGIRAGQALAHATLRALQMSAAEVTRHSTDYWNTVIDKTDIPGSSDILRLCLGKPPAFELVA